MPEAIALSRACARACPNALTPISLRRCCSRRMKLCEPASWKIKASYGHMLINPSSARVSGAATRRAVRAHAMALDATRRVPAAAAAAKDVAIRLVLHGTMPRSCGGIANARSWSTRGVSSTRSAL
jgi:hypothetical protein